MSINHWGLPINKFASNIHINFFLIKELLRNKILVHGHSFLEKPVVTLKMQLWGYKPYPQRTKLDT